MVAIENREEHPPHDRHHRAVHAATAVTPDVEQIALAVQACPAVAGLHSGRLGATVTHLPEGVLTGILLHHDEIIIGVVGRYPTSVAEIAQQIRAVVSPLAPGLAVVVHVEDMHVPDTEQR